CPAVAGEIVRANRITIVLAAEDARVLEARRRRARAGEVHQDPFALRAEHLIAIHLLVVGGRLPAQEHAALLVLDRQLRTARPPDRRYGVAARRRLPELLRPERAVDAPEVLVERFAHVPVDAADDALFAPIAPFFRQIRIRQERARHADHV